MENKNYNYLYKTTNSITGHFYVGIHSTDNLDDGYMGSGRELKAAISEFGKDNFVVEKKEFFETRTEAFEREKEIVDSTFVDNEWSYNISTGGIGFGEGRVVYSQTRENISKANGKPILHLKTGIYYDSIKEAANALGITYAVLYRKLKKNDKDYMILENDYRKNHPKANHRFGKNYRKYRT